MTPSILIIGPAPERDVTLFNECAKEFDVAVITCPQTEALSAFIAGKKPLGYVSYLPGINNGMYEHLSSKEHDAGRGMHRPIYQCIEADDVPAGVFSKMQLAGLFVAPVSRPVAWSMVLAMVKNNHAQARTDVLVEEVVKYQKQKSLLVEVGIALSHENDLERLLDVILSISRDIVDADAASIYIRERSGPGGAFLNTLRFKVSQNASVNIGKLVEFVVPVDKNTIAGYVAYTGKALRIDDVNTIDHSLPYKPGKDFQIKLGYCVKSMLTLPLKNKDGEVVGVLQMMNKKRNHYDKIDSNEKCRDAVIPFADNDEEFIESIASQAAVSIERSQLHENIRELFEGFLSASIAAIDERDKVTAGHSKRVRGYAMAFVEAAGNDPENPFSAIGSSPERKRQFQFAAHLHDIGKIGVPEHVLSKESRLPRSDFAALLARLDYVALALKHEPETVSWKTPAEVEDDRAFLARINTAGRLRDEDAAILDRLRNKYYQAPDGKRVALLSEGEYESLAVRNGNLTSREREIINSHTISTFRILSKMPWTRQLKGIPDIAAHHHEKLDGSGYPHGLKADQISMESKILAVVDIYEALVAQDRPYKPKMAPEKALDILKKEVEAGHLDADVVRFFIEKEIHLLYINKSES
jgi:HD-GYP domain-containing protein (c-di-GMP phosphodiesterase class II)